MYFQNLRKVYSLKTSTKCCYNENVIKTDLLKANC